MTQEEFDGQGEVQRAIAEELMAASPEGTDFAGQTGADYEEGYQQAEPLIPPDIFEYVKLPNSRHFLVLNGFRGPVGYQSQAAWHPQGFAYFPEYCYGCQEELKGKLIQVLNPGQDNGKWHDVVLTLTDESVCEIADKAYKEFSELSKLCADIKASHYPEAVVNAAPEVGGDDGIPF